jgi:hypothetical protein
MREVVMKKRERRREEAPKGREVYLQFVAS